MVAEVPAYSVGDLRIGGGVRLLLLDGVQDPGNVGTIVRTAAALGASATIALPGTVDLWNPKVVRGAMGAHFHAPVFHAEPGEVFTFLEHNGIDLWIADAAGTAVDRLLPPARLALAVGNEGAGVSRAVRSRAGERVALRLAAGVESLNVAVATGILLYALRPPGSA